MESLLKISLILSSPLALHVAGTPPNTPTSNDVIHYSFIEWILIQDTKYGLPLAKAISWAVAFTEVAAIASRVVNPTTLPSGMQGAVGLLRTIQDVPINSHVLSGTALMAAGGLLRWWCFRTLGRFFTFKLSVRKGHKLVTTGPYSVVRHPSYLGAVVLSIGMFILHGSWSSFIRRSGVLNIPGVKAIMLGVLAERIIAITSLVLRIGHEDEMVRSISKDEWEDWAKVVKYRLLPGIY
ncbi:Isoprenylcysteine carboxyl methyltransferase family-domain-containing protein [Suillus ampliporus]|nr:Isoprenylcysteine carboxyl methyltransferase family-domain-containing protein [Suillus ampliporus]